MNRQKLYKVLGKVIENGEPASYILCYTGSKQAALTYYVENGWKKEQIIFAEVQKGGEAA